MTIAATDRWATWPAVDGPGLVAWLEAEGHLQAVKARGERRLSYWRQGVSASAYTLDRLLTPIGVGLWEIPDELWLAVRPSDRINADEFSRSPDACAMP